jgi:uncharacterized protein (DUF305 family)
MRPRRPWSAWLAAVAALLAAAAAGCGEEASPGAETAASSGNPVDRAFVAGMVPHHETAIEMARIAKVRGQTPFMKNLADDIIASQTREIATMRRVDATLASQGVGVGDLGVPEHEMETEQDIQRLRTANPFDRAFIEMMVPHHRGAIRMAHVELARGADPTLKALSRDIIREQMREIHEMNRHLRDTTGRTVSPGGGGMPGGGGPSGGGMPGGGHAPGGGMPGGGHGPGGGDGM